MSQAVKTRKESGPISYCLGEGRRCRNYTAKLKMGDQMDKNIKAVAPDGYNAIFKLGGCLDLPAKRLEEDGHRIIETEWELSPDQLDRIIETKRISIAVIGESIQPISVQVV